MKRGVEQVGVRCVELDELVDILKSSDAECVFWLGSSDREALKKFDTGERRRTRLLDCCKGDDIRSLGLLALSRAWKDGKIGGEGRLKAVITTAFDVELERYVAMNIRKVPIVVRHERHDVFLSPTKYNQTPLIIKLNDDVIWHRKTRRRKKAGGDRLRSCRLPRPSNATSWLNHVIKDANVFIFQWDDANCPPISRVLMSARSLYWVGNEQLPHELRRLLGGTTRGACTSNLATVLFRLDPETADLSIAMDGSKSLERLIRNWIGYVVANAKNVSDTQVLLKVLGRTDDILQNDDEDVELVEQLDWAHFDLERQTEWLNGDWHDWPAERWEAWADSRTERYSGGVSDGYSVFRAHFEKHSDAITAFMALGCVNWIERWASKGADKNECARLVLETYDFVGSKKISGDVELGVRCVELRCEFGQLEKALMQAERLADLTIEQRDRVHHALNDYAGDAGAADGEVVDVVVTRTNDYAELTWGTSATLQPGEDHHKVESVAYTNLATMEAEWQCLTDGRMSDGFQSTGICGLIDEFGALGFVWHAGHVVGFDPPVAPQRPTLFGYIFLSYRHNSSSMEIVQEYVNALRERGVPIWLDSASSIRGDDRLRAGVELPSVIERALEHSAGALIIVSRDFGRRGDQSEQKLEPKDYIRDLEVPIILRRRRESEFQLAIVAIDELTKDEAVELLKPAGGDGSTYNPLKHYMVPCYKDYSSCEMVAKEILQERIAKLRVRAGKQLLHLRIVTNRPASDFNYGENSTLSLDWSHFLDRSRADESWARAVRIAREVVEVIGDLELVVHEPVESAMAVAAAALWGAALCTARVTFQQTWGKPLSCLDDFETCKRPTKANEPTIDVERVYGAEPSLALIIAADVAGDVKTSALSEVQPREVIALTAPSPLKTRVDIGYYVNCVATKARQSIDMFVPSLDDEGQHISLLHVFVAAGPATAFWLARALAKLRHPIQFWVLGMDVTEGFQKAAYWCPGRG